MITMRRFAHALLIASLATMALAVTAGELSVRTATLQDVYEGIHSQADACPDGTCPQAPSIRAAANQAAAQLVVLHSDRAELGSCGDCASLDALIAAVDLEAGQVTQLIKGWDDQG